MSGRIAVWVVCFFSVAPPAIAGVRRPAPQVKTQVKRGQESHPLFTVTAYCLRGKTASGEKPKFGIAAADPRILPMGSVIRVGTHPGDSGTFTIEDVGRRVRARTIDLYTADCATARRFGRRTMPVEILSLAAPSNAERSALLALSHASGKQSPRKR